MAMKNVLGMIYTGEKDSFLRELTLQRAIAAMPVAGRYRVIDFLVSSMVNSGMKNVGVIMQKNYHSLMDHLGSGKEWDLHGKNDGLYILPPFLTRENVGVYSGSLDAIHSNFGYLRRSRQEYVLLCNSMIVFNANFNDMFDDYLHNGADVSILYTKNPQMRRPEYGTTLSPRHSNWRLSSNTSATRFCALRLPSRVTARENSFSTTARPSLTCAISIRIACITSSGSKPAMTTGLRYSSAKNS